MEAYEHRLEDCMRKLPAKTKRDGIRSRVGRPRGLANPWTPPLALPFVGGQCQVGPQVCPWWLVAVEAVSSCLESV